MKGKLKKKKSIHFKMKTHFLKYLGLEFVWFRGFKTQILWNVWKEKLNNTLKNFKKLASSSVKSILKRSLLGLKLTKVLRKKWVLELLIK